MVVKRIISPLTPKQKAIVNFITKFHNENGYAPSLNEIAQKFELKAISGVHQHIEAIKMKGYLTKDNNQSRSLNPISFTENTIDIPLLGKIAAGKSIEPLENPEPLMVPKSMISGNSLGYYALQVEGDSMIEDAIWDKDIILIRHQRIANMGDMIVAVTSGDVTLKRFGGIENNKVKLIPRNPAYETFYVEPENFEIRGIFAGLIRRG